MRSGKPKTPGIKAKIKAIPNMMIEINGEGDIQSVQGGGHEGKMTEAEIIFDLEYLDNEDYEGGKKVVKLLDMKAYSLMTIEVTWEEGGEKKSEYKNYIWESNRHWW
jgi:hypothetical protein